MDDLRRCDVLRMTPAELAIRNAVIEVEKVGADERLTKAVVLLEKARNAVADFVDDVASSGPVANAWR